MTLEFGRPKTASQAWIKIPDDLHPNYRIDGGSYEHCAHFRQFILGFLSSWVKGEVKNLSLEARMAPLETEDIRLLFQVNSFYRDLGSPFTVNWGYIEPSNFSVWSSVLPSGDNNYRWWQITTLLPDVKFGNYRLYCIEMNDRFSPEKTERRFDEGSEFELVFARKGEMKTLKKELSRFR